MRRNRHKRIGSIYVSRKLTKSKMWPFALTALESFMDIKEVKKTNTQWEYVGYSVDFPYPKAFGYACEFTLYSTNDDVRLFIVNPLLPMT